MTASTDKIKDRIRKLLNLANDSAAFEGEIDNALRFARKLMLAHNVTEKDLQSPGDPHAEAAKSEYAQADAFTHGSGLSLWEGRLMDAVCKLVGSCDNYRTHERREKRTALGTLVFDQDGNPVRTTRVVFFGPAEDARDAAELFHEWAHTIATMGRLKFGGCFRGDGRAYCEGFVKGILSVLETINQEERKEISYQSTGTALVLRHSLDLMEAKRLHAGKWLRQNEGIKLRQGGQRQGNRNDAGAFGAGFSDGRNSNFSRARTIKIGRG